MTILPNQTHWAPSVLGVLDIDRDLQARRSPETCSTSAAWAQISLEKVASVRKPHAEPLTRHSQFAFTASPHGATFFGPCPLTDSHEREMSPFLTTNGS